MDYPPLGFHFRVDFLDLSSDAMDSRFQEVSGLSAEIQTEELVEGGENRFVHRLPVRAKYGNLVLKRGLLRGSGLVAWCTDAIVNFQFDPKTVMVALLNEQHEPLLAFNFARAYPVKWTVSDFKAQDNAIVVESLELSYDFFQRV